MAPAEEDRNSWEVALAARSERRGSSVLWQWQGKPSSVQKMCAQKFMDILGCGWKCESRSHSGWQEYKTPEQK